jgi:hypothetical protein
MQLLAITVSRNKDLPKLIKNLEIEDSSDIDDKMVLVPDPENTIAVLLQATNLQSLTHPAPTRAELDAALQACTRLSILHVGVLFNAEIESVMVLLNRMIHLEELYIYWLLDRNTGWDEDDDGDGYGPFPRNKAGLSLPHVQEFSWSEHDEYLDGHRGPAAARFLSTCQFAPTCKIFLPVPFTDVHDEMDLFYQRHTEGSWDFGHSPGDHMLRSVSRIRGCITCPLISMARFPYDPYTSEDQESHMKRLPRSVTLVLQWTDPWHMPELKDFLLSLVDGRDSSPSTSPTVINLEEESQDHPISEAAFNQWAQENLPGIRDKLNEVKITLQFPR